MQDDTTGGLPELQEETRAARRRTLELLVGVVLLSTLTGLAINLGSTVLLQALAPGQTLLLAGICVALTLLILVVLVPRLSTTLKEFSEEIELLLPLLVSRQDVAVIALAYFGQLDIIHDALLRRPAEERQRIADYLHAASGKQSAEARRAVTRFALETAQFLLAVDLVKCSRQLLGDEARYHKARSIARMQVGIVKGEFEQLARQSPGNPYFQRLTQGVPEKILLPEGVRLRLADVGQQLERATGGDDITLLYAEAGRDVALRITAIADYSEHALPTRTAPRRGLTSRTVLRNARDQRLHELAEAEEESAARLDANPRPRFSDAEEGRDELRDEYGAAHAKLYGGNEHPQLLRIFVRFDGAFRIRLLSSERRQRGLYAWSVALSRLLARADIEVFMTTLKEAGQRTPNRTF